MRASIVVVLGTALQDSCECVLDMLQLGEISSRHPSEQRVAVIESGVNYACNGCCDVIRQCDSRSSQLDVEIARFAYVDYVLVE